MPIENQLTEEALDAEARRFVNEHYTNPTEDDYLVIRVAIKRGVVIALQHVVNSREKTG